MSSIKCRVPFFLSQAGLLKSHIFYTHVYYICRQVLGRMTEFPLRVDISFASSSSSGIVAYYAVVTGMLQ